MQLPTSDETKLLLAGSVLDGNFSLDFSADIVGSFRGLLVVFCAVFNSLLLDCPLITFSAGWNRLPVPIVKFLRGSQLLT